jgi:hypothetical protein
MTEVLTKPATLGVIIIGFVLGVYFIWRAGTHLPVLRAFPAVDGVDEVVGRCVEMGRPIIITPGAYGAELNRPGPIVAALPIIHYIARRCAALGGRVINSVAYADTYAAVLPTVEAAYRAEGKPELFNPDDVKYWGSLEGYLTGNPAIIASENCGGLIQCGFPAAAGVTQNEMANRVGAMTMCIAANSGDSLVFYALCADYMTIGEEYYAASAAIAGDRSQLGSIISTDVMKIGILAIIIIGIVLTAAAPDLSKALVDLMVHG